MDSQNPLFLDILQEEKQGFGNNSILMAIPHLDMNAHQFPPQVEMWQSTPFRWNKINY